MGPYPTLNLQLNVELGLVGPMHDTLPPLLTRGVSITLWPCPLTLKKYLKAKQELWKLKYFTVQKYNLQKNPLKENQNPSRYHNYVSNLKFQHNPKCHFSKILI